MQLKKPVQAWSEGGIGYDEVLVTAVKNAPVGPAYDTITRKSTPQGPGYDRVLNQPKGTYDSLKQSAAQGGTYDSLKKKPVSNASDGAESVDYELADGTVDYDIADDTTAAYEIASAGSTQLTHHTTAEEEEDIDYDLADDTTANYELAMKANPNYASVNKPTKLLETDVDERRGTVFIKPGTDIRKKPVLQMDIMEA